MPVDNKTKVRNRLSDVDVRELSIVDFPANKRQFVLYKREGGGEIQMTIEELKKALEVSEAKVTELTKSSGDLTKKVEQLTSDLEKAKIAKVKKADMAEDDFVQDLTESVEVLKIGRTFSAKNESMIKAAVDALTKLLEQLKAKEDINKRQQDEADLQKQFDALPLEEQNKVTKQISDLSEKLDEIEKKKKKKKPGDPGYDPKVDGPGDVGKKMMDCPDCEGTGKAGKKDCPTCNGTGKVKQTK